MDKKTKKALLNRINKASDEDLVEILKFLREEGDVDFLIPLARVLVNTNNDVIKNEVKNIFLEVKRSAAPAEIIKIIGDAEFVKEKKFFTGLCWQLNLDFSPYVGEMLDFFIEFEDLEMALDMFSAIETTLSTYASKYTPEQLEQLKSKLKDKIQDFDHSKKLLSVELTHIFDRAKRDSMLKNINNINLD
jgi:hypothetical protein